MFLFVAGKALKCFSSKRRKAAFLHYFVFVGHLNYLLRTPVNYKRNENFPCYTHCVQEHPYRILWYLKRAISSIFQQLDYLISIILCGVRVSVYSWWRWFNDLERSCALWTKVFVPFRVCARAGPPPPKKKQLERNKLKLCITCS